VVVGDELLRSKGFGHNFVAVVDPCETTDGGSLQISMHHSSVYNRSRFYLLESVYKLNLCV